MMAEKELLDDIGRLLESIGADLEALREQLKHALENAEKDPRSALGHSRASLEALVSDLLQRWESPMPGPVLLDQKISRLAELTRNAGRAWSGASTGGHAAGQAPPMLPVLVHKHFCTVREYGNFGAHLRTDPWDKEKSGEALTISLAAWRYILQWFEARFVLGQRVFGLGEIGERLSRDAGLRPHRLANLRLNRSARLLGRLGVRLRCLRAVGEGGVAWNLGDSCCLGWEPAAICTARDDGDRPYLLVAWTGRGRCRFKGVRLSVLDMADPRRVLYRHVLLVSAGTVPGALFGPLPLQAETARARRQSAGCAMAVVGSLLLFADGASAGFRVFDLGCIFTAASDPTRTKVGTKGGPHAYDYRYILPQVGTIELPDGVIPQAAGPHGSPAGPSALLIAGAAARDDESARTVVNRYVLSGQSLVPCASPSVAFALPGGGRIYGVVGCDDRMFLLSGEGATRTLVVRNAVGGGEKVSAWPRRAAGLALDWEAKDLWSLIPGIGSRAAFHSSLSLY